MKRSSVTRVKQCPKCGERVNKNARFCLGCGLILDTPPGRSVPEAKKKPQLKLCPECGAKVDKKAKFCISCGLIFFTQPAKPIRPVPPKAARQPAESRPALRIRFVLLLLAVIAFLGLYDHPRIKILLRQVHRVNAPEPVHIETGRTENPDFDFMIQLPLRPHGIAWKQGAFVLGNNDEFLGFLRLTSDGNDFLGEKVPLWEQNLFGTRPVLWNGKEMIGYVETGFFEFERKQLFTVHDPNDFRVTETHPAPSSIGGLAWDGSGYWTATRAEEPDPKMDGFLYRLDPDFNIVTKWRSPSPDCRGLAWDGSYLWFLDGLSGDISMMNIRGSAMDIVRSYPTPVSTPSGIAFDGKSIWVSDYESKRLYRSNSEMMSRPARRNIFKAEAANVSVSPGSPSSKTYHGPRTFPDNDVEVNEFSVQVLANMLIASWSIHFGPKLFTAFNTNQSGHPANARFTVTIHGGTQTAPEARVFSATPGKNTAKDVTLLDYLGPGTFRIGLLLYVEYTDEQGHARTLTKSIPSLQVSN